MNKILISRKSLLVEAEFFHAHGRTDTTKLIFAFHNFAEAPNNVWIIQNFKQLKISRRYVGVVVTQWPKLTYVTRRCVPKRVADANRIVYSTHRKA